MGESTITPEPRSPQAFSKTQPQKNKPLRHLKVRKSYYTHSLKSQQDTPYATNPPVPWVEIKGYWLNQAGFEIGKAMEVEVSQGCITLRLK